MVGTRLSQAKHSRHGLVGRYRLILSLHSSNVCDVISLGNITYCSVCLLNLCMHFNGFNMWGDSVPPPQIVCAVKVIRPQPTPTVTCPGVTENREAFGRHTTQSVQDCHIDRRGEQTARRQNETKQETGGSQQRTMVKYFKPPAAAPHPPFS